MDRPETVVIVGVGLIGGSIGMALRARKMAGQVIGVGRDETKLRDAVRLGAIDRFSTVLERGVAEADVAVVCTPVDRIADDVRRLAEHAPDHVLITDAGSTKRQIVEAVEKSERARRAFVAAHPIAGSERQGAAHGRAELFDGRVCALTPTAQTPPDRLGRAREFWQGLGCRLVEMDPERHDHVLALTSHLPHAVASALANTVPEDALALAAGAYRDVTRVASADATLWTAIFRANRQPLLQALAEFRTQLAAFEGALVADDETALQQWWASGRDRRSSFSLQPVPKP